MVHVWWSGMVVVVDWSGVIVALNWSSMLRVVDLMVY